MPDVAAPDSTARLSVSTTVPLFVATTLTASTLLFLVQPMFAKMVLPRLGGSPAVWTTCVLFFQAALLLGYGYAHVSTTLLGVRRQALGHLVILALALFFLPLTIGDGSPPAGGNPVWWLLGVMTVRLGVPFLALSTMAPLVQRWFAALPLPSAANPYFLYAASNLGSMVALLSYPLILEPVWGTQLQSRVWSAGYALLLILAAACAWTVRRCGHEPAGAQSAPSALSWRQRSAWIALAAVPSSLMLGVTMHISTDLASIPLLWVLPLAAYLLTFILAFSTRTWIPEIAVARALPFLAAAAMLSVSFQLNAPWLIPLHLAAFFAAAFVCHTALARSRPPAQDLTAFYVWMSFGGMLGGVFNTLVAPRIFAGVYEYPIGLALACLSRPAPAYRGSRLEPLGFVMAVAVMPIAVSALTWAAGQAPAGVGLPAVLIVAAIVPMLIFAAGNRRAPFNVLMALSVGALMATASTRSALDLVFAERSFFGVSRVIEAADHSYRLLQHGSTLHGRQNMPAGEACEPQSYYGVNGPMGQVFREWPRRFSDVAVVGLGSGALSCYADPGSRWSFFEIDPLVERIARDERMFTFLRNSRGSIAVEIGDGRKKLEEAPPGAYDLVVLDAFSSDSVPAHLLTAEALGLYRSRLRPGGMIAVHISNRYLDLEPVLTAGAAGQQLYALANLELQVPPDEAARGRTASHWILLSDGAGRLSALARRPGWQVARREPGVRGWTDDYSNLLTAIKFR